MENNNILARLTVLVILVVVVVSGPLVPAVSFTDDGFYSGITFGGEVNQGERSKEVTKDWTGNAVIEVESIPKRSIRYEQMPGNNQHVLVAPPAVLTVSEVVETPILVYVLNIPELGVTNFRAVALDNSSEGRLEVDLVEAEIDSGRLNNSQYDGVIRFKLRGDDNRMLYEENVTISVDKDE